MDAKRVFVGRDAEVGRLCQCVADLGGGRGRVVLVDGEAGIGKSTLLKAGLAETGRGIRVFWGVADELGGRFALRAILTCFGQETRAEVVRPAAAGSDDWLSLVNDPVLAALERLLSLVDRMCTAGPVVLVLDDLQWADDASVLAWSRLAQMTVQQPLLLVSATRPVPRTPELAKMRRSMLAVDPVLITLTPLNAQLGAELAGALAGAPPGPRLTQVVADAGGNPLYVTELVDALLREGRVRVASTAELAEDSHVPSPPSLTAAITDRLSSLSETTLAMLRIATLFGTEFAVRDLATVSGRTPVELLDDLDSALTEGLLESRADRLAFRHPLIRTVLYTGTSLSARTALHGTAAQRLATAGTPAERVAEQLLSAASDDVIDQWALDWLSSEVSGLVGRAPKIAAMLLERALVVLNDGDPRLEQFETVLAVVLRLLHRFVAAEALTRRVLRRTPNPAVAGQMAWILAYCLMRTHRRADAIEWLTETLRTRSATAVWTARLHGLLAAATGSVGRYAEAVVIARQAAAEAATSGDRYAIAFAANAESVASMSTDLARSLALTDQALQVVPDEPDGIDLRVLMLSNRSQFLLKLDRIAEAEVSAREAVDLADRVGTARLGETRVMSAMVYFATGRWDDVEAEFEPVDELVDDLAGSPSHMIAFRGLAALIAVHRDDPARAEHLAGAASDTVEAGALRRASDYLMLAKAAIAERRGHRSRAVAALAPVMNPDCAADTTKRFPLLPMLVRLALANSDFETVNTAIAVCLAEAERYPLPGSTTAATWCRALVAEDAAALGTVAAYYRKVGRPLETGHACEDLAALLGSRGEAAGARAALTEAVTVYTRLGARWDIRRAERRLARHGVRSGSTATRERPATGWDALTPTELTVAELVAEGLSNSDIAVRMFLSRRTVQTHVSHILTKLGVRSRVDITRHALARKR